MMSTRRDVSEMGIIWVVVFMLFKVLVALFYIVLVVIAIDHYAKSSGFVAAYMPVAKKASEMAYRAML